MYGALCQAARPPEKTLQVVFLPLRIQNERDKYLTLKGNTIYKIAVEKISVTRGGN